MRKIISTMPISSITLVILVIFTLFSSILGFAQDDVSKLDEKQLIAKLESGKVDDTDYKKIKEEQLTDKVLEKADLSKLSKLDNSELNKKFKTKSISIDDKVDVKYGDGKLKHPLGDSISVSSFEGKEITVTKDGFVIKKSDQNLKIDGNVGETNIDKDGNVKVGDTTYKVGGQQGDVSIKRDPSDKEAVLTNAGSVEIKGKKIFNEDKGDMQIIQRENGAFGVQSNGADVQVHNQIGKDHTAIANLKKGEKYYEIPTETGFRQGLTNGGKLDYNTPEKKYSIESNSHSFMDVGKDGKLEKVAVGYQAKGEVIASYTETKKDGSLISKTAIAGGDGFTIYKKAGFGWGKEDPGLKIENQEGGVGDNVNKFDVHEKTFSDKNQQLTITTNGVNTYISPSKGIRAEKIGASSPSNPEKEITTMGKEVTISPDGKFDLNKHPIESSVRKVSAQTPSRKSTPAPNARLESTELAKPIGQQTLKVSTDKLNKLDSNVNRAYKAMGREKYASMCYSSARCVVSEFSNDFYGGKSGEELLPRYGGSYAPQSFAAKYKGNEVTIDNAQPGDIVIFNGNGVKNRHIGTIVETFDASSGRDVAVSHQHGSYDYVETLRGPVTVTDGAKQISFNQLWDRGSNDDTGGRYRGRMYDSYTIYRVAK